MIHTRMHKHCQRTGCRLLSLLQRSQTLESLEYVLLELTVIMNAGRKSINNKPQFCSFFFFFSLPLLLCKLLQNSEGQKCLLVRAFHYYSLRHLSPYQIIFSHQILLCCFCNCDLVEPWKLDLTCLSRKMSFYAFCLYCLKACWFSNAYLYFNDKPSRFKPNLKLTRESKQESSSLLVTWISVI